MDSSSNLNTNLVDFFESVKYDLTNKSCTPEQIMFISQFYIRYKTDSKFKSNSFNVSIADLLSAGILFYSTLGNTLDLNINYLTEDENKDKLD
jgi:hypothetical protein